MMLCHESYLDFIHIYRYIWFTNRRIVTLRLRRSFSPVFPEFNVKPENQIALADSNVTFDCNASGVPGPVITWLFDGGHLPYSLATNGTLSVYHVQNSDSFEGNYTCIASNRAGLNSSTATLTVDGMFKNFFKQECYPIHKKSPLQRPSSCHCNVIFQEVLCIWHICICYS